MTQPGYQAGNEPMLWWKVALHLDEAQLALANAMAHNVDDPRPIHALYDRLREGQAILLDIFRAKGLLPGSTNGAEVPMSGPSVMPMPVPGMPGMPADPVPMCADDAVAAPPIEQALPLAAEEPAAPEVDQDAAVSELEQVTAAVPSPAVVATVATAVIVPATSIS